MKFSVSALAIAGLAFVASAQETTRPVQGLREKPPGTFFLSNATVHLSPGRSLSKAHILIRDGRITEVGTEVAPPEGTRQFDLTGKTVYPGFVETYFPTENLPLPENAPRHWNPLVHPEADALAAKLDPKKTKNLRSNGFTAAHLSPGRGIIRGQSAVIQLGDDSLANLALRTQTAQHFGFELNSGNRSDYPRSLMGCIALIRQTLGDANWYRRYQTAYINNPTIKRPENNPALAALAPVVAARQPVFFAAQDELDCNRALGIAEEFRLKPVLIDTGHASRIVNQLRNRATGIIVPLHFPPPPALDDPATAADVSLERLQHWRFAPSNPVEIHKSGIPMALTSAKLKKPEDFWPNLRKAVKRGLSPSDALRALTVTPATMLDVSSQLGDISKGKLANLVIAGGDLFQDDKAKIEQVWVDGEQYEINKPPPFHLEGRWIVQWNGIKGPEHVDISVKDDGSAEAKVSQEKDDENNDSGAIKITLRGNQLVFAPSEEWLGGDQGTVRLSAFHQDNRLTGLGSLTGGAHFVWTATRADAQPDGSDTDAGKKKDEQEQAVEMYAEYPAGAYGVGPKPEKGPTVLVRGATLWTCGPLGKIEADLLVRNGIIEEIGEALKAPDGAVLIDANGKHVTPGLIDCHSHTAISRGVNEGSDAVTVEVRIGDVVDPTDINIYRQLGGGLTTANLLHGSANPMGGQNQVIKLRWGGSAEDLKIAGAKPGVKFALGENVKQSNWGDDYTTRYPQTRMGVEQIMRDTFTAAREYGDKWKNHQPGKNPPPRRNLRLDAALEILNGDRIVHIHSYRQDEILMFVRLAETFGFTVGTFQHVLEGYKVADAIAGINAGGSTFSDWWAYKFEVYDAIPYNGAILKNAGVVTSFNSDDSELARRMNTEAAKAVKYGGVSEEEALKFVTLNPALQLRIAHRTGSLEPGKDADFVIWSGPPLSTLSHCEQTWIDGHRYFDLDTDKQLRDRDAKRRKDLIHLALQASEKEKEKEDDDGSEDDESPVENWRELFSPWYRYHTINYQGIYHDGQSLHTCTGALCNHR